MDNRTIVCLIFFLTVVPACSGFVIEEVHGLPQGYLESGAVQEIDVFLWFPDFDAITVPSDDSLTLNTDLKNPKWTVILKRSGVETVIRTSSRTRETVPGWDISYPTSNDVRLIVQLRGAVPDMGSPDHISILSIRQLDRTYQLRPEREYSVSQIAYPAGEVPSGTPPDPVIISPPPPDLSAFTVSPRYTTPSRDLGPGETVTLRTYLTFNRHPQTTFPLTDTLRFRSALKDAKWDTSIVRNGNVMERLPGRGYYYSIPGFELSYPSWESLSLHVAVSGTVPEKPIGPLLEITQCGPDGKTRAGAIFTHPAGLALSDDIEETPVPATPYPETPAPTETPDRIPDDTPSITPKRPDTPLPPPEPKGELFPDGFTIDGLANLLDELIWHGSLFLRRILSISGIGNGW
ncbi:MAG: hypothetical protein D5R96_08285 [Methanocalculus sp. MSAO_Arc2]|uniref:hypothetical protein n=1 Tax=Methanocalculus sp. MSAO_Arc2 TaxID=2293855 RepID=UPI000FF71EB4|nr:MAG: hypothetical protein D5R96_08285 [Methanocalculus sp. MSAO_Arc2]